MTMQVIAAVAEFERVRFVAIGREENKLADALAAEALAGRLVAMPGLARLEPAARSGARARLGQLLRRPRAGEEADDANGDLVRRE